MNSSFNPKVSIIIPVYNGSNFLEEAINSALAQTYKNIEIIVVNDGSNDDGATERIAKSYGSKIKYYSKKNGGVASALNFGISKMSGDYFSWLSHDDRYMKNKISKQIDFLRKHGDSKSIIVSNVVSIHNNGVKKKEKIQKRIIKYFDIFLATSAIIGINGCSLLIPAEALKRSDGFDEKLKFTQDYDLWHRLAKQYNYLLLDDCLVISRRHDQQDSVKMANVFTLAADNLHYSLLKDISIKSFFNYFSDTEDNISFYLICYRAFRANGYLETAAEMLKILLKYYHKIDIDKFNKLSNAELVSKCYDIFKSPKDCGERFDASFETLMNEDKIKDVLSRDKWEKYSPHGNLVMNILVRTRLSIHQDGFRSTAKKVSKLL